MRRCDLEQERTGCLVKTFINARQPTPIRYSMARNASGNRYNANNTINFVGRTQVDGDGYVLEWWEDVGFSTDPGDRGLCNFGVFDVDSEGKVGPSTAFGDRSNSINQLTQWGCCFYE